MGCLFPKADGLARYWANIRRGVDAITEVPASHWRPEDYYDPDPKAPDKTYVKKGGFLDPVDFPALDFGISPNNLDATDTTQLLGLITARAALDDAGYGPGRVFDRSRVSVIMGVTGAQELVIPLGARLGHPIWRRALAEAGVPAATAEDVVKRIADSYPAWQENSFPGLLGNVAAGRIANRLDLGGTNCVIDAACASSLGALHLALLELHTGRCDLALTGGLDTFNDIFMYMCFSKTPALSPRGEARPFDAGCDGTILGEGLGVVALKRLDDARRDGDRVYAVIKGVGSSSDGKGQAVYAPVSAGQAKALRQAYTLSGFGPETVGLVEAHGTGTKVGDAAELAGLTEVYRAARPEGTWCALGSVKSQIGHTKAAAGAAGLIKAALALHHKVLPPTAKVDRPMDAATGDRSPFYVNAQARPWLARADHPRRAAVSAFGFGGSNFHCVLEEAGPQAAEIDWDGDTQIVAFSAATPEALASAVGAWPDCVSWPALRSEAARSRSRFRTADAHRLTLVVGRDGYRPASIRESARARLDAVKPDLDAYRGAGRPGKLAMLFPGQGTQYVGMSRSIACQFPAMLEALGRAEAEAPGLVDRVYPREAFTEAQRSASDAALRSTDAAQPAIGAISAGLLGVLRHFEVSPELAAGHSYGELSALRAAGRIDGHAHARLSAERGRLMASGRGDRGAMLAVWLGAEQVRRALAESAIDAVVANANSPSQTVVSGPSAAVDEAEALFQGRQVAARRLDVAAAFHSRLVADAEGPLREVLGGIEMEPGVIPVYANTSASPYPSSPDAARDLLAGQLARPVDFAGMIAAMAAAGASTFLEVGPGAALTGLVGQILADRPHSAIAVDASKGRRGDVADLARALAQLAALGHAVDLSRWDPVDEAATPASPKLTVPVSGANAGPRPSTMPPIVPKAAPTPMPDARRNGTHAPDRNGHPTRPTMTPIPGPTRPVAVNVAVTAVDPGLLAVALRDAQEGLLALQRLGEQTAALHRQFLDGQDKTQQALASLLERQRGLGTPAPGMPIPPAAPRPAPAAGPRWVAPSPPAPIVEAPPKPLAPIPHRPTGSSAEAILFEVVAEKTGYPVEVLDASMELEADLGVDSIKRVEILAAVQDRLPDAPPVGPEQLAALRTLGQVAAYLNVGPAPVPARAPTPAAVASTATAGAARAVLFAVVAEKTGYPVEVLDPEMELEADLGVDSIKRVEILAAVQDRLPGAPPVGPEQLAALRTLRQVADYLDGQAGAKAPAARPAGDAADVLFAVVAEKTGYPREVLDASMELEADLGVDSIKRVEILAAVQDRLPGAPPVGPEQLAALRTLGQVAAYLNSTTVAAPAPRLVAAPRPAAIVPTLDRWVVRAGPVPVAEGREPRLLVGEVWVVGVDEDLTRALVGQLAASGVMARHVDPAGFDAEPLPDRLGGLVLLGQAAAVEAFRTVRRAGPSLRRAPGAILATVSRLDGRFGLDGLGPVDVAQGGLAGLAKTAGREWPEVRCRAFDLDPTLGAAAGAAALAGAILGDGPDELGLRADGQTTPRLEPQPPDAAVGTPPIAPGDLVVVTGGARGVTAEAALALATAWRPSLLILGRTPGPTPEPAWLSTLADEATIKRSLMERANGHATPRRLGDQFRALTANREVAAALARVEAAGASVMYRSVDVRDAAAVGSAIHEARARYGPVRGLVHGAGVLADRRIEDLDDASFDEVHATKIVGLENLLAAIGGDDLRALGLFSSTTARLGRAGQAAYASANEILNKRAQVERSARPGCRVVAINWGPWDGGMVSPGLKPLFEAEGIGLIGVEAGARALVAELERPPGQAAEVVILGAGSRLPEPTRPPAAEPGSPSLALALERVVDPETLPILRSHVIDGRPVLPMALILEWLAQAALRRNPGLAFLGVDDLRLLKGVVLADDKPAVVRVFAGKAARVGGSYAVEVELRGEGREGRELRHARGVVMLGDRLDAPPAGPALDADDLPAAGPLDLYPGTLFHGPDLQAIERVEALGAAGIVAQIATAPAPSAWDELALRGSWLADPLALDGAFQMLIVWCRQRRGAGSLPTRLGRYRQYARSFPAEGVRVVARVVESGPHKALADIEFRDSAGALVARIDDYECVIDASLNRAFRRPMAAGADPR